MMPSRSVSSANFSGVHFTEIPPAPDSTPVTVNIFAPTEKHRSLPHLTSSVTPGNERQNLRSCSRSINYFPAYAARTTCPTFVPHLKWDRELIDNTGVNPALSHVPRVPYRWDK